MSDKITEIMEGLGWKEEKEEEKKEEELKSKEGICRVCKGTIIESTVYEYDPMTGPPVIGPGYKRQQHKVSKGFYCEKCGIKYQFIPD